LNKLIEWARGFLTEKRAAAFEDPAKLSQLTIVIPSYCRQDYLLRQIVNWAFSPATVIVVDGSPVSMNSQLSALNCDLPNVTYISLVDTYANRLREACRHIRTPYAMCLADDDFFLKAGLCRAMEYLDENTDNIACIGQAMALDFDGRTQRANFFPYGASLWRYRVADADPIRRIRSGIDNYRSATSYSVFRSSAFMGIWEGLRMTSCLEAVEYEHAIGTYTLGRLASIDDVYWIRSFECDPIDSTIDGSRHLDFARWWSSPEFEPERIEFVNRQVDRLVNHSSATKAEANIAILETIACILDGRHTGLMNQTRAQLRATRVLKFVKSFPFLDRAMAKLMATRLGVFIRKKNRAGIPGTIDRVAFELDDILAFVAGFHGAL